MQYPDRSRGFCQNEAAWNLPARVAQVASADDVSAPVRKLFSSLVSVHLLSQVCGSCVRRHPRHSCDHQDYRSFVPRSIDRAGYVDDLDTQPTEARGHHGGKLCRQLWVVCGCCCDAQDWRRRDMERRIRSRWWRLSYCWRWMPDGIRGGRLASGRWPLIDCTKVWHRCGQRFKYGCGSFKWNTSCC